MTSIKLRELIKKPETNLSKVLNLSRLENTIENNEWHLYQTVLDHTLLVFNHIENIFQIDFPFSNYLVQHKIILSRYAKDVVSDNHSRLALLKCAALFHDLAKPDTIIINAVGITSCPNHAIKSANEFKELSKLFDIDDIEENYIIQIIEKHHAPDKFLDFIGTSDYSSKKNVFIEENKLLSVDLLVFYLADFEGCKVDDSISKTKSPIYSEAFKTIGDCLHEFYGK